MTFRVDAYPTETFHGMVKQVRLNPTTVQNVVTYSTVIDVPNPDYKLKPGMTANVTIEVARRENVLRVPNGALRFRPTADIFAALHQAVPPELERGFGRGNRGGGQRSADAGAPLGWTASGRPGQRVPRRLAHRRRMLPRLAPRRRRSLRRRVSPASSRPASTGSGQAGAQGGENRQRGQGQGGQQARGGGDNAGGGNRDGGQNAQGGAPGQGGQGVAASAT